MARVEFYHSCIPKGFLILFCFPTPILLPWWKGYGVEETMSSFEERKRLLNSQRNNLEKPRFSTWCKEGSEVKTSSTDLDIAEESDNSKIAICDLTEQGTNKKKQQVIQDSTWCYDPIFFFITCISFWEENTNQNGNTICQIIFFLYVLAYKYCIIL